MDRQQIVDAGIEQDPKQTVSWSQVELVTALRFDGCRFGKVPLDTGRREDVTQRTRGLVMLLRLMGLFDFCAFAAVVAPREWIATSHERLGLGTFPAEPIVEYLARCTSVWYASYGLLLWFVSFDVESYARLIQFLSCVLIVQGIVIVGIDLAAGMPGWWTTFEGPCCSGLGAILLVLQRRGVDVEKRL